MGLKYSDFKLQPLRNHKFKLLEPIKYYNVLVPKNFTTDGASVPRAFWWLFPPNRTDYLPCAIIHDYLCNKGEYRKADEYFKQCLEEINIPKWQRWLMVTAVVLYHTVRYPKQYLKGE